MAGKRGKFPDKLGEVMPERITEEEAQIWYNEGQADYSKGEYNTPYGLSQFSSDTERNEAYDKGWHHAESQDES